MLRGRQEVTVLMLIERLTEILKEEGNLPIWVVDTFSGDMPLYEDEVEVADKTETEPKRVSI